MQLLVEYASISPTYPVKRSSICWTLLQRHQCKTAALSIPLCFFLSFYSLLSSVGDFVETCFFWLLFFFALEVACACACVRVCVLTHGIIIVPSIARPDDAVRNDELWVIERLLLETKGGDVSAEVTQLRKTNEAQARQLKSAGKKARKFAKDAALHKSAADVEKMERDTAARHAAEEHATAKQLAKSLEEQEAFSQKHQQEAQEATDRVNMFQTRMDSLQERMESQGMGIPIYPPYWRHQDLSTPHIGTVNNTRFMGPKLQALMRSTNLFVLLKSELNVYF